MQIGKKNDTQSGLMAISSEYHKRSRGIEPIKIKSKIKDFYEYDIEVDENDDYDVEVSDDDDFDL